MKRACKNCLTQEHNYLKRVPCVANKTNKYRYLKNELVIALIFFSTILLGQSKTCWPIFRGDPSLSGLTVAAFPRNMDILWTYTGKDMFKSSVVFCDGMIVTASMDGTLYGIDEDGKERWLFKGKNGFESSAMIYAHKVYIGDMDGILYCLNLSDGKLNWQYACDGQIMGSPNVYEVEGQALVLFGSYDYHLYALSAENGDLRWKYESDNYINGAASCINGKVVFGGCDGFLHVLNIASGLLEKKVEVASYVAGSSALEGDRAYTGDYDGRLSCIDLNEEKVLWQWEDEVRHLAFMASPAIVDDKVLAASRDKFLYCFNKNDGALIWKHNTGSRVDASPIISGNKVLVVNMRGDVDILSIDTGDVIQHYELGVPISGTPASIDGKIILAAEDGLLYCLGDE